MKNVDCVLVNMSQDEGLVCSNMVCENVRACRNYTCTKLIPCLNLKLY